jgi:hypothetical protein
VKSLHGNWREERLFTLRQSLELYRTYVKQIATADQKIESLLSEFVPRVDPGQKPLPADGKKNRSGAKRRKAEQSGARRRAFPQGSTFVARLTSYSAWMLPRSPAWRATLCRCSVKSVGI